MPLLVALLLQFHSSISHFEPLGHAALTDWVVTVVGNQWDAATPLTLCDCLLVKFVGSSPSFTVLATANVSSETDPCG